MPKNNRPTGTFSGGNNNSIGSMMTDAELRADAEKRAFEQWKRQEQQKYDLRLKLEQKFGKNSEEVIKRVANFEKAQRIKNQKDVEKELKKQDIQDRKAIAKATAADPNATGEEKRQARADYIQADFEEQFEKLGENLSDSFSKALSGLSSKISGYFDVFSQYAAAINTRLQGTDKSYDSVMDLISGKLFGSPFVKQTEVLEKLNELVSAGISYNVEQRAFLASMTDKMVTTFDVANGTLLRIIRLQQADSTVARMGMESALNKYLNATYQDTTYLTDLYDNIETSLVDAISQLGRDAGVEFEYVVQKWLGSLYSVGMSESSLSSIAEGINYLATGNVSALSQNSALQNLLIMGANRAGLNYAQMLQNGISSSDLNKLLAGIASYGQGLANTDNMVVKSAYSEIFGISLSDMTALLQMGDDLAYVINQTLDYSGAVEEARQQLASVGSRTAISEMISNVFDNIMMTTAKGIATSAGAYTTWLITDILEQATGGINIPFISVVGSGVDLNASVTELMKIGIMGFSLLGQIGTIISGLSSGGALSLNSWGATDYTARGSGFTGINAGSQQTTSFSAMVGNSGGSDIASGIVTQEKSAAETSVSGQETEEQEVIDRIDSNVNIMAEILSAVYNDNSALRVVIENYGLINGAASGNSSL